MYIVLFRYFFLRSIRIYSCPYNILYASIIYVNHKTTYLNSNIAPHGVNLLKLGGIHFYRKKTEQV